MNYLSKLGLLFINLKNFLYFLSIIKVKNKNEIKDFKLWWKNNLTIGKMVETDNLATLPQEIKTIINVCDFSSLKHSETCLNLSIKYFWFPMSELKKDIGINSIYAALRILYDCYKQNEFVYLHCWSGCNRSQLVSACFYWMMTGEDLERPTYGARNDQDTDNLIPAQYKNRLHYNCIRGTIPPEKEMKEFLLYLKGVFENGYFETKIGLIDHCKAKFFSNF